MNHDDLGNYSHTEVRQLREQVAALTKELETMRHLAAQPHAIQAVHDQLGPISLWGAKALEQHIAREVSKELAAAQATNERLREALENIKRKADENEYHPRTFDALAIQNDTAALYARLAQEREKVAVYFESLTYPIEPKQAAAAIRSMT